MYGIFGWGITKHTIIYGVHMRIYMPTTLHAQSIRLWCSAQRTPHVYLLSMDNCVVLQEAKDRAEREAEEAEKDKGAGACSCFGGPSKTAAKKGGRQQPRPPMPPQQLKFAADADKVRLCEFVCMVCLGGGGRNRKNFPIPTQPLSSMQKDAANAEVERAVCVCMSSCM